MHHADLCYTSTRAARLHQGVNLRRQVQQIGTVFKAEVQMTQDLVLECVSKSIPTCFSQTVRDVRSSKLDIAATFCKPNCNPSTGFDFRSHFGSREPPLVPKFYSSRWVALSTTIASLVVQISSGFTYLRAGFIALL
eukprot:4623854-Amphidinium_carterae.1